MPKGYSIKLVAEAQTQLRSIANDEFRKRMNPNTAIKNVRKLMDAIISLSYMPNRINIDKQDYYPQQDMRKMIAGDFLIYFTVDEADNCVIVRAISYGKMDQKILFISKK